MLIKIKKDTVTLVSQSQEESVKLLTNYSDYVKEKIQGLAKEGKKERKKQVWKQCDACGVLVKGKIGQAVHNRKHHPTLTQ